jgi:hypothetical protein
MRAADIVYTAERLALHGDVALPALRRCARCGYMSSQAVCKARARAAAARGQ